LCSLSYCNLEHISLLCDKNGISLLINSLSISLNFFVLFWLWFVPKLFWLWFVPKRKLWWDLSNSISLSLSNILVRSWSNFGKILVNLVWCWWDYLRSRKDLNKTLKNFLRILKESSLTRFPPGFTIETLGLLLKK